MTVTRLGTANMYDRTVNNIGKQQSDLASQMEHASAGKRVLRASDDPVAAAQAERARTRLNRVETDQRVLDAQTATIRYGESTLGEINDAIQSFRQLVVNAGNGVYTQNERDALVQQMESLRDQILTYSNRKDSNGLPLFRGLDTESNLPFPNGTSGIQSGQTTSGDYNITNSLDGVFAFFSGKTGNGVLAVEWGQANPAYLPPNDPAYDPATPEFLPNTGKAWADIGAIKDLNELDATTRPLEIVFSVDPNTQESTYSIAGGAAVAYKSGEAIRVAGMDLVITGQPANGDTFHIKDSAQQSLFTTLNNAIATVRDNGNTDGSTSFGSLAHGIARSLSELDIARDRVSTVRGLAGDLLNQAETMGNTLLLRSEQMETQRSNAEDIDMVAALSQLKTQETAVSAALQSYASIQKLSLFNFIN